MDNKYTKEQLIAELESTQRRLAEIGASEKDSSKSKNIIPDIQARYWVIMDNLLEGCQIIGRDWRYLYVNEAIAVQGRHTRGELLGHTMMEMYPGIEKTEVFKEIKDCMVNRVPNRVENLFTYPDGSQGWFELSIEPITEGVFILSLDITEQKQAERFLVKINRALLILSHCNQALVRSNSETELLNEVCRVIVEMGNYRFAWVGFTRQDESKSVVPVAQNGYENGYLDTAKITWAGNGQKYSPTSNAIKTGKPSVARNISEVFTEHWSKEAGKRGYASAISLPLIADGKTLGVLNIYAAEPDAFDPEEVELLSEMSSDLAFGITTLRGHAERKKAEEEIRQSEKKYQDLYDEAPIAYFTVRTNGRIIMANKRTAELLGYTKDELSGSEVFTLYADTPQGKEKAREIFERFSQGGSIFGEELEMLRSDGAKIWVRLSVTPIINKKGQVVASRSTVTDITRLKQAEESLREREEFLDKVIEHTPSGMWISDDKGTVVRMNQALRDLLKVTDEEILGKYNVLKDTQVIEQGLLPLIKSVFEEGKTVHFTIDYNTAKEKQVKISQETNKVVEIVMSAIQNKEGKVIHAICQQNDITERKKAEEDLRESVKKYRELADSIAGIFFAMDKELRYTYWNKASEELTGVPGKDVLGKSINKIFPDNAETKKAVEYYNEVLRTKEPAVFVNEYTISGRDYIFEINAYPSGDGITVFCRDITERERMQGALLESEERFSKAFRASPDMIIISGMKDGKYIEVNDSFIRATGYSREEIIGHTVDDLNLWVNPKERVRMARLLDEHGRMRAQEYSFRMNSGDVSIWRCSAEIINLSGESCVIAVASDVTEQKRSEESLRESEERSRVILESIPQGVIFSDVDGKIIEINNAVRRMHKYEHKEEIVGRQFLELIPGKEHARITGNYKETLEAGYSGALLYSMIKKDGSLFSAELTAAVIKDDAGKPVGFVTVTEDISGRKNIEEQIRELEVLREVDNLRSQLLSNVSHELRTPLTSIKGFVSTLLRTDAEWSSEEQREFLEIVNQEADRLTRLISDLLDMSRLDAGAMKLNRDIHHVSTILESIESRLANLTSGRRLLKSVPDDLPPVFVDEMRVGQVLTNLIENAIKYSPEGCDIVIEARLIRDDVVISVIDKGAGIPYELIDKIFDRFYQTESIVTGRKSGTGLGLSICRGIIEAHGGRIWVESKLGQGSNFSFSVPIDSEENNG